MTLGFRYAVVEPVAVAVQAVASPVLLRSSLSVTLPLMSVAAVIPELTVNGPAVDLTTLLAV